MIVELLKDKKLLPKAAMKVQELIMVMDESLRPQACTMAAKLRRMGRTVDVVLENKRMKWAFKHAERIGAGRLIIVGGDEWARGNVCVKDLAKFDQVEVPVEDLYK